MLSRARGWVKVGMLVGVFLGLPLVCSSPAGASSSAGWRWPLAGVPTVLRPFQPPPTPYAAGHRGVDLAAATGASVLAAGDGVIGFAGMLAGRGVITVLHGALRTTYEPVSAVVHVGQPVTAGVLIGHLSSPTGHCGVGRSCLHWGLLRGDTYLDPLMLLGLTHSILLPVWGAHPPYPGAESFGAALSGSALSGSAVPGASSGGASSGGALSGGALSGGGGNQTGRAPSPVAAPAAARPAPSSRPSYTGALLVLGACLLLTTGGIRVGSSPRNQLIPRKPP